MNFLTAVMLFMIMTNLKVIVIIIYVGGATILPKGKPAVTSLFCEVSGKLFLFKIFFLLFLQIITKLKGRIIIVTIFSKVEFLNLKKKRLSLSNLKT